MSDRGQVAGRPDTSRVFFALWPDDVAREKLHLESRHLQRQLGGKATRPDTLHLTLVFVGDVENGLIDTLKLAASQVEASAFAADFDQVCCWRHNHIAYRAMSRSPDALLELVSSLEKNLAAARIPFDARPYKPHITLVRKADCARLTILENGLGGANENPASEPIRWLARDFVLVKSSLRAEGARYEQLGRWPLL